MVKTIVRHALVPGGRELHAWYQHPMVIARSPTHPMRAPRCAHARVANRRPLHSRPRSSVQWGRSLLAVDAPRLFPAPWMQRIAAQKPGWRRARGADPTPWRDDPPRPRARGTQTDPHIGASTTRADAVVPTISLRLGRPLKTDKGAPSSSRKLAPSTRQFCHLDSGAPSAPAPAPSPDAELTTMQLWYPTPRTYGFDYWLFSAS